MQEFIYMWEEKILRKISIGPKPPFHILIDKAALNKHYIMLWGHCKIYFMKLLQNTACRVSMFYIHGGTHQPLQEKLRTSI